MKQKLPVIFAIISAVILISLIVVGLVAPGSNTEKSSRLFASSRSGAADGAPSSEDKTTPDQGLIEEGPAAPAEAEEASAVASVDTSAAESDNSSTGSSDDPKTSASGASDPADDGAAEDAAAEETRTPLEKYAELLDINPYAAGWLSIDDSKINGPVVYTPRSQNFFLHRDIDGSDAEKGTYFIACIWRDDYNNTLIYGHNMRDGSGFGSLVKYADASYGLKHPVIHFDTLYEDRDYELFAVFYSQIEEEELETEEDRENADREIEEQGVEKKQEESGQEVEPEELTLADLDLYEDYGDVDIYRQEKDEDNGRFRYYYYTDLSDKADFDYFVENVKERALYDTGVDVSWGDELLTLSTCSYHVNNGRLIVVAKRIDAS